MAAPPLTPHQLRFEVARVRQKDPEALVIGLHAQGRWDGDGELSLGECRLAVVRADTVLEVREALVDAEAHGRPTVVLTALEQSELGDDVVARLARSKLWPVDPWEGVKGLFKARQLDPALRETCLARALLEHKPPDRDYDPVPAGVLDAGTAWRTILHHAFGMEDREPDLPGLLRWAAATGADRYLASPADLREATRSRLDATLGPVAGAILHIVESGAARDALALAVACEVVFAEGAAEEPGVQAAAAVRLEPYHDRLPIPPDVGRALARAGRDALEDLTREGPEPAEAHLLRADAILREVQATPLAHLGSLTPLAWDARLRRLAGALSGAAEPGAAGLAACEGEIQRVADHALSGQASYRDRLERARMALRLLRWLRTPEDLVGSFDRLARLYVGEISFVDWARDSLAGGDELPELSDAFGRIERAVAPRRAAFGRAFATALADWTRSGSDPGPVLRVEDVAAGAIARVLDEKVPVLLVVLDGMSWPVAHELLADLRRLHWSEALLPGRGEPPPPVVAAIPSVTELSRTSLLAGLLHRGSQNDERRLFPVNPALLARCERNHPPVLFHKAGLTEGGRGALARPVAQAILDPHQRLVATVINAVDDRLAGASQVRDTWSVEAIRPLGALLRAAREAGRAVFLASDHGHVWHRDAPPTPASGASEVSASSARWRPADGEARDGEVLLEGGRVRGPGDAPRLIAAWADETRYTAARNGYHGGASPQEMVAPLVLLADATARQPMPEPCEPRRPAWWDGAVPGRPANAGRNTAPPTSAPTPRTPAGYLFPLEPSEPEPAVRPAPPVQAAPAPTGAGWLERLVHSPAYQAQRQMVRKFAPEDRVVLKVLEALGGQDGSMTPAALARRVDVPLVRLDGLVAKLQRLLNLDGYDVLKLDRHRDLVELDVALLRRQFELEQAEDPMEPISAQRRREIIDALRRGTVPQRGLDVFAVGLGRFEPAVDDELRVVAEGGAGFKALRGEYGSGKTFFARWLQERAKRAGFATSEVQISEAETPLHRLETVYRRAMERLSTADAFQGAFRPVVDGWFYGLEEEVLSEGGVDPSDEAALATATEALLEKRLSAISRGTPQFALALRGYRRARAEGDAATAEGLIAWLAGQPHVGAAAKKAAGIKGDVDHFAALSFLQGLLTVLRDSGYAGLVLVLDEIETLQRVRGDVREKGLNALRQLVDEVDAGRFPGLYLVVTGTPAFYDGPQGVRRLEPLAQRLHVDFQTDARFDNPRAVQVRLPGFDHGRLVEVGRTIRDLYAHDAPSRDRILALADDAYVAELARAVTGDLGGRVGVAPRLFLKKLVGDVLDRIDQHPDFDPRRHYRLTVADGELTRVERAARGALSVDDVELDP